MVQPPRFNRAQGLFRNTLQAGAASARHAIGSLTRQSRRIPALLGVALSGLAAALHPASAQAQSRSPSLASVLRSSDLVILADVKHGVRERIAFFSSPLVFETMARAGVRHVAIEIPHVLGRQAMTIETAADIEAFAGDVIRSGRWHFVDPDHPNEISDATQRRVATAIGRQVLLAKRLGLNPIFYDFNNPLGGFASYNDPIYRCIAGLDQMTWLHYGLDGKITKSQRDAAIMRERFSHDDELAQRIEREVRSHGGGKVVVIPGYAHAVLPGGIADRLQVRLKTPPTVVAVFTDEGEHKTFHSFLWEQARLLSIDLSRPPNFYYTIADQTMHETQALGRYVALDGARERAVPSICYQLAQMR